MSESGGWQLPSQRWVTFEEFKTLLLEIRNGASAELSERAARTVAGKPGLMLVGADDDDELVEPRAVWHAAEVALGVLLLNQRDEGLSYLVKREAMADAKELVRRYEDISAKDDDEQDAEPEP
jgi:hypothetical protein